MKEASNLILQVKKGQLVKRPIIFSALWSKGAYLLPDAQI